MHGGFKIHLTTGNQQFMLRELRKKADGFILVHKYPLLDWDHAEKHSPVCNFWESQRDDGRILCKTFPLFNLHCVLG